MLFTSLQPDNIHRVYTHLGLVVTSPGVWNVNHIESALDSVERAPKAVAFYHHK